MSTNRWFPMDVSKYSIDTMGMTYTDQGIYLRLLCYYWTHQRPLLNDYKQNLIILKITKKKYDFFLKNAKHLLTITDDYIHVPWMDEEIVKARNISEKRKLAGAKGGKGGLKIVK